MNSEELRVCRRCLLLQSGKDDIMADIKERIEKMKPSEKATDEIYSSRLSICSACDFLADGTCLKCGCYPEFRAAFAKNRCPHKKW